MHKTIFLLSCLFVFSHSFSQDSPAIFPDDNTGVYKGMLQIHASPSETQKIPMEFHLQKTDSPYRFDYVLVYDGQPRNYTLVATDPEHGIFDLDENNGIVLPMSIKDNVLSSIFQVGKVLLITRMEFTDRHITFEILSVDQDQRQKTGEVSGYEIYCYPNISRQKAILVRQEL